jgi:CheY-like chemotaxis protein
MDVHMPGMDGISATKEIRAISPNTIVVIVTAARSSELAADALAAGAVCYLTKNNAGAEAHRRDPRRTAAAGGFRRLSVREPAADALRAS